MVEGKKAGGYENGRVVSLRRIFRLGCEQLQGEDDEPRSGQNERDRPWGGETRLWCLSEDFVPPVWRQLAEGETFQIVLEGIGWGFHGFNSS